MIVSHSLSLAAILRAGFQALPSQQTRLCSVCFEITEGFRFHVSSMSLLYVFTTTRSHEHFVFFVCLCMIVSISTFSPCAIALSTRHGQWNDFSCFLQQYLSSCQTPLHIYYMSFSGVAVAITVACYSYIFINLHSVFVVSYSLCERA